STTRVPTVGLVRLPLGDIASPPFRTPSPCPSRPPLPVRGLPAARRYPAVFPRTGAPASVVVAEGVVVLARGPAVPGHVPAVLLEHLLGGALVAPDQPVQVQVPFQMAHLVLNSAGEEA